MGGLISPLLLSLPVKIEFISDKRRLICKLIERHLVYCVIGSCLVYYIKMSLEDSNCIFHISHDNEFFCFDPEKSSMRSGPLIIRGARLN